MPSRQNIRCEHSEHSEANGSSLSDNKLYSRNQAGILVLSGGRRVLNQGKNYFQGYGIQTTYTALAKKGGCLALGSGQRYLILSHIAQIACDSWMAEGFLYSRNVQKVTQITYLGPLPT